MKHTSKNSADYWDAIAPKYIESQDSYLAGYHANRFRSACELLEGHGGRLFDFGCGSGELFEHLRGFELEGCDVSPEMIARSQRRYPSAKIEVGGIDLFLQKTGPYGVIVALNVLPYLSQPDEAKFFE